MLSKNKINYKLVNLALIALIAFLVYLTGNLWIGIIKLITKIFLPFLFAFAIAYAVYPFLEKMKKKGFPKWLGVTIIMAAIAALIALIIFLITTVLLGQVGSLFSGIIDFFDSLQKSNFSINLGGYETSLESVLKGVFSTFSSHVSNGAIKFLNVSLSLVANIFMVVAGFIYFLIDMEKIREDVKLFLRKKSKKTFNYVKTLDGEMRKYLFGLVQVIFITLVEYSLAYTIIGHPNALLLGFLAACANLIPYFGGIGVNIIASITAFVVSPSLLVRTFICFFILSSVDSYVINPTVYGKTNSIHPLITIIALFAGGIIFGILGVFISFPLTIIATTTIKYYKKDIKRELEEIKAKD